MDHARWCQALAVGLPLWWFSKAACHRRLSCNRPSRGAGRARRGQATLGSWTRPIARQKVRQGYKGHRVRQHIRRNRDRAFGQEAEGKAPPTLEKFQWLVGLARPAIGARPVSEVTAPEVLAILRSAEARGKLETARRLRSTIGQVFRYAVSTGRADADPTGALKGALSAPIVQHRAAIIEPKAFGGLLCAISGYEGAPETRMALELISLTLVRPGELRAAEWTEFDLDAAVWSIPGEKMKMRRPHRVPLAASAVASLRELQTITGHGKFVFPSIRLPTRCMSENTINGALRRLGFTGHEMTSHGFRSSASSILNESGLWNADAIERQLAHVDKDSVRRAYARADFWDERVRMMTWWADRCEELRLG